MQVNTVPARTGYHWFKLGYQNFRRQPLAWILLVFPAMACSLLMPSIAWVGPALSLAMEPLMGLLMMIAAAQVLAGHRLRPAALLAELIHDRNRFRALLALCALYAIASLCLLALKTLIDDGDLAVVLGMKPTNLDFSAFLRGESPMQRSMLWTGLAMGLAFWFSPALVHWHGTAPLKAVWLNIAGFLLNWRAFLVFLLSWAGFGAIFMLGAYVFVLIFFFMIGHPQSTEGPLFRMLMDGAWWAWGIPFCASQIFSFRDCFPAAATPAGIGLSAA